MGIFLRRTFSTSIIQVMVFFPWKLYETAYTPEVITEVFAKRLLKAD